MRLVPAAPRGQADGVNSFAEDLVVEFDPPVHRGSARSARDFTRETLARWGYRGECDEVVLVVSELVANAVRHASGRYALRLVGGADQVRVEVADESPVMPSVRKPGADGGWGLALVRRMSARWGAVREGRGKVVWCELRAVGTAPVVG